MGLFFTLTRFRRGFTLIEVMVVVAIIGILASVLFASFEEGRQQSRDKFRQAELKELQLAIELYKAQNGRYPAQGCGNPAAGIWAGPGPHPGWGETCNDYIIGLVPDYLPQLPRDPNKEDEFGLGYLYRTSPDQSSFKVIVHQSVESQLITSRSDEFSRFPAYCTEAYANLRPTEYSVYSAGADCW